MEQSKARGGGRRGGGRRSSGRTPRAATEPSALALQLTGLNWILLAAAVLLIVAGFAALAAGSPVISTALAPFLLVAGFGVLIPLGLIL